MRLIDADLLYARVVKSSSPNLPARTKTTVQNMIDRAPTEDAVSREDFDVLRSNFNRQAKLLEEEHAKAVGKEGYGMSDYISRADAIEAVAEEWLSEASVESPYINDDDIGEYRKLAEELFEDLPSADAVHGEWTKDDYLYKCSVCGNEEIIASFFCPNCGARMKGGDDE